MNVEAVRGIAQRLSVEASSLEAIRTRVDGLVATAGSVWRGGDSAQFADLWRQDSRVRIVSLVQELQRLAKAARDNADAQERVSREGVQGGLNGTRSANPPGHDTYRGGRYGRDRDMVDLSQAAYDHTVGLGHDAKIPTGWHEVSAHELSALGMDRARFGVRGQQFSATLYRDDSGHYVLAYEGTNPGDAKDWWDDTVGSFGVSYQGHKAIELAQYVKDALNAQGGMGDSLEFTGHSLGGGLASLASISTGNRAVTFNAAGVDTAGFQAASRLYSSTHETAPSWADAERQVTAYSTTNDPLSILQDSSKLPDAFGQRVILDPMVHKESEAPLHLAAAGMNRMSFNAAGTIEELSQAGDAITDGHMLERMADAMDRRTVREEEWYH